MKIFTVKRLFALIQVKMMVLLVVPLLLMAFTMILPYNVPSHAASVTAWTENFESNDSQEGWFAFSGGSTPAISTEQARSKGHSLKQTGRTQRWHTPAINIYDILKLNGAGTYYAEMHVYLSNTSSDDVRLALRGDKYSFIPAISDTLNVIEFTVGGIPANEITVGSWLKVFGSFQVTNSDITAETGTVNLCLGRAPVGADVYIDDVILIKLPEVNPEPGWYWGDNHTHTVHSDAFHDPDFMPTVDQMIARAIQVGLDFITITDHNATKQRDEVLAFNEPGFLAMYGNEITANWGHFLAYDVEYMDGETTYHNLTSQQALNEMAAQGSIVYLAHPLFLPASISWQNKNATNFTGIEVWNSGGGTRGHDHPFNLEAFEWWDELNRAGRRIFGSANSDAHATSPVGNPRICAYMDELSEENFLKAMRTGTFYGSNGPVMTFSAQDHIMGSDYAIAGENTPVTISVSGANSMKITAAKLLLNGEVIKIWTPDDFSFSDTYAVNVSDGDFVRFTIEADGGGFAFSNPIWFTGPSAPTSAVPTPTPPSPTSTTSSTSSHSPSAVPSGISSSAISPTATVSSPGASLSQSETQSEAPSISDSESWTDQSDLNSEDSSEYVSSDNTQEKTGGNTTLWITLSVVLLAGIGIGGYFLYTRLLLKK